MTPCSDICVILTFLGTDEVEILKVLSETEEETFDDVPDEEGEKSIDF